MICSGIDAEPHGASLRQEIPAHIRKTNNTYKLSVGPCCFYSDVVLLICGGVASGALTAVCGERSLAPRGLLLFQLKGGAFSGATMLRRSKEFQTGPES